MSGHTSQSTDSTATLTVRDDGPVRYIQVDCRHATTTVALIAGGGHVIDPLAGARLGLLRHYAEEGCRCTRRLRRRYGVDGGRRARRLLTIAILQSRCGAGSSTVGLATSTSWPASAPRRA
jgi:hypothetical protein